MAVMLLLVCYWTRGHSACVQIQHRLEAAHLLSLKSIREDVDALVKQHTESMGNVRRVFWCEMMAYRAQGFRGDWFAAPSLPSAIHACMHMQLSCPHAVQIARHHSNNKDPHDKLSETLMPFFESAKQVCCICVCALLVFV